MINAFFSFSGRMQRMPFLLWTLALWAIQGILLKAFIVDFWDTYRDVDFGSFEGLVKAVLPTFGLIVLVILAGILITSAIFVKRLHDCGWTGWLALLVFLPMVGLAMFAVLLFMPSTPGRNRYGPDPHDPDAGGEALHESTGSYIGLPIVGRGRSPSD